MALSLCFFAENSLPNVGGAEIMLHQLATRLSRLGHRVVVVAPRIRGCRSLDDYDYCVSRFRKPFSKRFAVRLTLPHLIRLHAKYRFDVLHCHAAYPQPYIAATLKRWFGVPFVVRPHGMDVAGRRFRANRRLENRMKRSLANSDAVIAQGETIKQVIAEFSVDPKKIHVIHNGVDLAAFSGDCKYSHPRPYILALGNLSMLKGFDVLLQAYARIVTPRADLVIAGDGPQRHVLSSLAKQLGIASRVEFVGHVQGETKIRLYRAAELFVCPSRFETFSNVVLEALAAGLPVVATSVGGNIELVRDGQEGLLCRVDDECGMAEAIDLLLNDRTLNDHCRSSIPSFVRQFDWPRIVEKYLQLYQRVVADSRMTTGGLYDQPSRAA